MYLTGAPRFTQPETEMQRALRLQVSTQPKRDEKWRVIPNKFQPLSAEAIKNRDSLTPLPTGAAQITNDTWPSVIALLGRPRT